jgi:hypothetical protein
VPPVSSVVIEDTNSRHAVWNDAIAAAATAADEVREHASSNPELAGDAAAAAAEVLTAAGRLLEGELGGPISRAAADYDRAARDTYGRRPPASGTGDALRFAAAQLIRAGLGGPRKADAVHVAILLSRMARLAESVAELRAAQHRHAQAAAAARADATLNTGSGQWMQVGKEEAAARQAQGLTRAAAVAAANEAGNDSYASTYDGRGRGGGPGLGRGRETAGGRAAGPVMASPGSVAAVRPPPGSRQRGYRYRYRYRARAGV